MNKITIFNYEGNTVRTVMKDGNPWWVPKRCMFGTRHWKQS